MMELDARPLQGVCSSLPVEDEVYKKRSSILFLHDFALLLHR